MPCGARRRPRTHLPAKDHQPHKRDRVLRLNVIRRPLEVSRGEVGDDAHLLAELICKTNREKGGGSLSARCASGLNTSLVGVQASLPASGSSPAMVTQRRVLPARLLARSARTEHLQLVALVATPPKECRKRPCPLEVLHLVDQIRVLHEILAVAHDPRAKVLHHPSPLAGRLTHQASASLPGYHRSCSLVVQLLGLKLKPLFALFGAAALDGDKVRIEGSMLEVSMLEVSMGESRGGGCGRGAHGERAEDARCREEQKQFEGREQQSRGLGKAS